MATQSAVTSAVAMRLRQSSANAAAPSNASSTTAKAQVLVRVAPPGGDADAVTREALRLVQEERICWLGGSNWHGMEAMRISVSNWSTTEEDVDRSADSIVRAARAAACSAAL